MQKSNAITKFSSAATIIVRGVRIVAREASTNTMAIIRKATIRAKYLIKRAPKKGSRGRDNKIQL